MMAPSQSTSRSRHSSRRAFLIGVGKLALAAPLGWRALPAAALSTPDDDDEPAFDPNPYFSHQRIFEPTDRDHVGLIRAAVIQLGSEDDAEVTIPDVLDRFFAYAESEEERGWEELSEHESDDLGGNASAWSGEISLGDRDDDETVTAALAASTNEHYVVLVAIHASDLRERDAADLVVALIERMRTAPFGEEMAACGTIAEDGTRTEEEWNFLPTVADLPEGEWEFAEEGDIPWLLDDGATATHGDSKSRPDQPVSCLPPEDE